jgi:hypothetical protein
MSVNVNYGVYSLMLDTDKSITLTGTKVYFTKFFANREMRRLDKELAERLAADEAYRLSLGDDDNTEIIL